MYFISHAECKPERPDRLKLDNDIYMSRGSKIIASTFKGNASCDQFSTIARSFIGKGVNIACFSYIQRTEINNFCTIGSRVSIGAMNHPINWLSINEFQYRNLSEVNGLPLAEIHNYQVETNTLIEPDVWVGDNVVVLPGRRVATGCIVGAGSVVAHDTEPYSVVVGNPASHIKYRFPSDIIQRLLRSKWWERDYEIVSKLNFSDPNSALISLGF